MVGNQTYMNVLALSVRFEIENNYKRMSIRQKKKKKFNQTGNIVEFSWYQFFLQ